MTISIKGKNLEVTTFLQMYVQRRMGQLEKFMHPLEAHFFFDRDPHHHAGLIFQAEVNLIAGGKVMHAEARAQDTYEAVDLLMPKLKEKISRFKNRKTAINHHARSGFEAMLAG